MLPSPSAQRATIERAWDVALDWIVPTIGTAIGALPRPDQATARGRSRRANSIASRGVANESSAR
jgi:hypothetical protein